MESPFVWHPEVLPAEAHQILAMLAGEPSLASYYLAGGTALALQWGHRTSIDLDFFTGDVIDEDRLLASLHGPYPVTVISKASETSQ